MHGDQYKSSVHHTCISECFLIYIGIITYDIAVILLTIYPSIFVEGELHPGLLAND